jgi:hypothetical protein
MFSECPVIRPRLGAWAEGPPSVRTGIRHAETGANTSPVSRGRAHAREAAGNQRPWPADKVESANTSPVSRGRAHAREAAGNQRPWPADKVERWAIARTWPACRPPSSSPPNTTRCATKECRRHPFAHVHASCACTVMLEQEPPREEAYSRLFLSRRGQPRLAASHTWPCQQSNRSEQLKRFGVLIVSLVTALLKIDFLHKNRTSCSKMIRCANRKTTINLPPAAGSLARIIDSCTVSRIPARE